MLLSMRANTPNLCSPEAESQGQDSLDELTGLAQRFQLHRLTVSCAHEPQFFDGPWVALVYESAIIFTYTVTHTPSLQ